MNIRKFLSVHNSLACTQYLMSTLVLRCAYMQVLPIAESKLKQQYCVFAGGLNYQIEHHLFPTLPRHNLAKIQNRVQSLCERHGLLYETCGMGVGTVRVLQRLAHVASHA